MTGSVFFDARFTRFERHDGISRYGAELVTALARLRPVTLLISDTRQLRLLPDLPWAKVNGPMSPAELLLPFRLNRLGATVVVSPMQVMGSFGRRYRLVLTLHDLIYYAHPTPPRDLPAVVRGAWRLFHRAWWPQRALLDRADAVLTVSETSARLIREHGLTRRPLVVVPNAPAPHDPVVPPDVERRGRDLVYMGSFMPYKNVETLVRALRRLPGWRLHLLSRIAPARRAALARLAPAGTRLIFHDGVGDAEYDRLLDRATALVTASEDEGFGLPVVEAMARGVPVVLSDIPIFREVAGAAGCFAPAHDARAFAEQVLRLEDPEVWRKHSLAGLDQAATFTWERSARRLARLLDDLGAPGERG